MLYIIYFSIHLSKSAANDYVAVKRQHQSFCGGNNPKKKQPCDDMIDDQKAEKNGN
jgi:hypothetical protein